MVDAEPMCANPRCPETVQNLGDLCSKCTSQPLNYEGAIKRAKELSAAAQRAPGATAIAFVDDVVKELVGPQTARILEELGINTRSVVDFSRRVGKAAKRTRRSFKRTP